MDRKALNKDQKKRDAILAPYFIEEKYSGGCRMFEGVPPSVMRKLMEEGFVDETDRQNDSPTIKELVDFAERGPVSLSGYAVEVRRPDYRVSVDGLDMEDEMSTTPIEFEREWYDLGKSADLCDDEGMWWD